MKTTRKKELRAQYELMKPDMGIFTIRCLENNRCHIEAVKDLKSSMNLAIFKLDLGNYPIKELQQEWRRLGKSKFAVEVLENLPYEEDESVTNYQDELELLEITWAERLEEEGKILYK